RTIASRARRHPARTAGDGGDGGTPADAGRTAGPPARVPPPRPRAAPGGAGGRRRTLIRPVRPPAPRPPHLALGPFDPAVVEFGYLEQVELHDLEVGGEVEVPWRYDGGELAAEDRRVGRRGAAQEPIAPAPRRPREGAGRERGEDREADVLESAPDQARADDLRGQPAPELEGAAPEAPRDETHREEVPREVPDVLQVVAVPELGEDLVEDAAQIVPLQSLRSADGQVHVRVLGHRRGEDPLGQCLDHHVLGIPTIGRTQRGTLLGMASQELVPDVEHRV